MRYKDFRFSLAIIICIHAINFGHLYNMYNMVTAVEIRKNTKNGKGLKTVKLETAPATHLSTFTTFNKSKLF
jgi:hypothetical protein